MKKIFLFTSFIIFSLQTIKAQDETFTLTVEVFGLKKNTGKVFLAVFDNEGTFLKTDKEVKGMSVIIVNNKAIAQFKGLKKGDYALSLFHDKNNNNKLDTNFIGIPKEPYAFSNNATGFMGPPSFKDSKISLNADKTIAIKLN
ncbi:DUF2141 domain-containing protein [Polaribacter gangjinensis]|uniref:DUF2141 domain-containing protein n=1 Tax=Polaribacter gangjinensis TaxID=574710 RepID=UPI000CF37FD1|nr:DUF2141 domain-containing protein [Polaribacter gangjinensis]